MQYKKSVDRFDSETNKAARKARAARKAKQDRDFVRRVNLLQEARAFLAGREYV